MGDQQKRVLLSAALESGNQILTPGSEFGPARRDSRRLKPLFADFGDAGLVSGGICGVRGNQSAQQFPDGFPGGLEIGPGRRGRRVKERQG